MRGRVTSIDTHTHKGSRNTHIPVPRPSRQTAIRQTTAQRGGQELDKLVISTEVTKKMNKVRVCGGGGQRWWPSPPTVARVTSTMRPPIHTRSRPPTRTLAGRH